MGSNQDIIDQGIVNESKKDEPVIEKIHRPISLLNERSIYLKGLFGLILCIAPGAIVGLVLIKLSLDQAKVAMKQYKENPAKYTLQSYKKVKTGRTMARIGLGLFILEIIILVTVI